MLSPMTVAASPDPKIGHFLENLVYAMNNAMDTTSSTSLPFMTHPHGPGRDLVVYDVDSVRRPVIWTFTMDSQTTSRLAMASGFF